MRLVPQFETSSLRRITAFAAVLLIAGLGLVQAIHLHEFAPSDAGRSHCALCVFSHTPAVLTAARSAPALVSESASLVVAEPQLRSRLLLPASFIRPPPVS